MYIHVVVQPISRTFSSCKTKALYPLNDNPPFLLRPVWQPLLYFFASMNLTRLGALYKRNHIGFVFWGLTAFT